MGNFNVPFGGGWGDVSMSFGLGRPDAAPYTGPPIFAGADMFYLTPSDLVGTIAMDDPITDLPAQGGLITGNFSAAGTARPILKDDGTGRIGAYFDGEDDQPTIDGLTLDLTAGFTLFLVKRIESDWGGLSGFFRSDAGSDEGTASTAECYTGTTSGPNDRVFLTRRLGGAGLAQSAGVTGATGALLSVGGIWSGAAPRGVYLDGTLSHEGTLQPPSATITRIQLAGFEKRVPHGYLYQLVIYKGILDAGQRTTVRDYLRDKWNDGVAF